ncbi:MAG: NADH-quinone oxidoreductase subunit C [Candidatus Nanopelagicales bacterium]
MRADEQRIDAGQWHPVCAALVADGASMLDMIAAVDEPGRAQIDLVVHLVDVDAGRRHLVWTAVPRAEPELASLTGLLPGSAWHEREIHEMFGVRFAGNPDLSPLLTDGQAGFPLRRTTALPRRVATPWPGAVDPADRPASGGRVAARPRTRPGPPGIPSEWSP